MFEKSASQYILKKLFNSLIKEKFFQEVQFTSSPKKTHRVYIQISAEKTLSAQLQKNFSFSKVEMISQLILTECKDGINRKSIIQTPSELIDCIAECYLPLDKNGDLSRLKSFSSELENSVQNLSLAMEAYEKFKKEFKEEYPNIQTSIELVRLKMLKSSSFSPHVFYEQSTIQGHPAHPCAKTKIGLNPQDICSYAAEWRPIVALHLVAVHRNFSKVISLNKEQLAEYLLKQFPEIKEKIELELKESNLDLNDFEIFPVHPWQYHNAILKLYTEQIQKKSIIPLKTATIDAMPLISFRSFCSYNQSKSKNHYFHIKTPVNMLATSDIRTISARAAESGPLISKTLSQIIANDPDLKSFHFHILKEFLGAYYHQEDEENAFKSLSENLSVIYRENPEKQLNEDEICLPAASLIEKSPLSDKLILIEFIEEYYRNNHFQSIKSCAKNFFKEYLLLSIKPFLILMCRYGISLEGHLQNTIIAFDQGKPTRIFIRDFADIRISKKRLNKQNYGLDLSVKNSYVFCQEDAHLYRNVFHAVYQNHYYEIILVICSHFSIPERNLWKYVYTMTKEALSEMKKKPDLKDQILEDEKFLFKKYIQTKALTKMRLLGEINNYYFVDVENPLYFFDQESIKQKPALGGKKKCPSIKSIFSSAKIRDLPMIPMVAARLKEQES